MAAAEQLGSTVGLKRACHSLGIPRGTLYRHRARAVQPAAQAASRPPPPLKLDEQDVSGVPKV